MMTFRSSGSQSLRLVVPVAAAHLWLVEPLICSHRTLLRKIIPELVRLATITLKQAYINPLAFISGNFCNFGNYDKTSKC